MATQYYFDRDTKVYAHVPLASLGSKNMYFELPVLDGFSFSQATNTSEITLNQAQANTANSASANLSLRARQMFNDSYAPAEWSFSTYMSPYTHDASETGSTKGTTGAGSATDDAVCEVSEALYALFFSQTVDDGLDSDTTDLGIVMSGSNKATVGIFDLYFVLGAAAQADRDYASTDGTAGHELIYKIADCSVNELSFDFDIDGIATVNWSGQGKLITDYGALDLSGTGVVYEGVSNTTGFIRNRVSDLVLDPVTLNSGTAWVSTLTGGNITMSNNLTYLTPETLGVINQPLGHVTGTRNIGGNFTCYLDNETNASASMFEDLIEATTDIQNVVSLAFDIGATATPYLALTMPQCHLEVPTHAIDDVISLETNFHALPSSIDGTDEISVFNFFGKDVNA